MNVTNVEDRSITTMKSEKEHRTNYASLPLILNYHFNKLTLGVGTQLLYNISSNQSNSIYSSRQGAAYDLLSFTKTGSALSTLDYGALFKVNYLLSPRFSVQARAYFGLSDISKIRLFFELNILRY